MDFITLIIIAAVVLPIIGGLLWFVFYVWLAKKAVDAARQQTAYFNQSGISSYKPMAGMGGLGNQDFMVLLNQLENMMRQYNTGQLSAQDMARMNQLMYQTQNQFQQMDQLSQQRYDTRVSEMMGYAASNGLDWHP